MTILSRSPEAAESRPSIPSLRAPGPPSSVSPPFFASPHHHVGRCHRQCLNFCLQPSKTPPATNVDVELRIVLLGAECRVQSSVFSLLPAHSDVVSSSDPSYPLATLSSLVPRFTAVQLPYFHLVAIQTLYVHPFPYLRPILSSTFSPPHPIHHIISITPYSPPQLSPLSPLLEQMYIYINPFPSSRHSFSALKPQPSLDTHLHPLPPPAATSHLINPQPNPTKSLI